MIYTDTKWFCDACGKEMKDYIGSIELNRPLNNGQKLDYIVESKAYDFCIDCMKSFNEWKRSRMT